MGGDAVNADRRQPPQSGGLTELNLRERLRTHRYRWVCVGDENAVADLAGQPDPGWLRGWFPVDPTEDKLELILSKAAFTTAAETAGIPIPPSAACRSIGEGTAAAAGMGYPVMLKAARGYAGNGVVKADDPNGLARGFDRLRDRVPVVVQRWVEGRVGATQVLIDHGRPACCASSYKKLACYPKPFGPNTARQPMVHPAMEAALSAIGRRSGFHGICGVDWIHRASDGALLVLEFNPRPAPVIHLGPHSGVCFSAALADMLAGRPATRPTNDVGPRRVFLFPQHPVRCIEKRCWRDLVHWIPTVSHTDLPWRQPRLLGVHSWRLGKCLTTAVTQKFRKPFARPTVA
jgi:hypothetical protein